GNLRRASRSPTHGYAVPEPVEPVARREKLAMIHKVTVQNFKRFREPTEFSLKPQGVTYLAGGNNSGKSTLLQALAVWEFTRSILKNARGERALLEGNEGKRLGISADQFSPIALPDLRHLFNDLRHLSTRIRCDWTATGDGGGEQRHLEFGLLLSKDRL